MKRQHLRFVQLALVATLLASTLWLQDQPIRAFDGCTAGYMKCNTTCPTCQTLCEQVCEMGWDGTSGLICSANGSGFCEPNCGVGGTCYTVSCGCVELEEG